MEQIREHIEYALGTGETFEYYDEGNLGEYEIPDEQIEILTGIFFNTFRQHSRTDIHRTTSKVYNPSIRRTDIVARMKATLDEDEYTSYDGSANKVADSRPRFGAQTSSFR